MKARGASFGQGLFFVGMFMVLVVAVFYFTGLEGTITGYALTFKEIAKSGKSGGGTTTTNYDAWILTRDNAWAIVEFPKGTSPQQIEADKDVKAKYPNYQAVAIAHPKQVEFASSHHTATYAGGTFTYKKGTTETTTVDSAGIVDTVIKDKNGNDVKRVTESPSGWKVTEFKDEKDTWHKLIVNADGTMTYDGKEISKEFAKDISPDEKTGQLTYKDPLTKKARVIKSFSADYLEFEDESKLYSVGGVRIDISKDGEKVTVTDKNGREYWSGRGDFNVALGRVHGKDDELIYIDKNGDITFSDREGNEQRTYHTDVKSGYPAGSFTVHNYGDDKAKEGETTYNANYYIIEHCIGTDCSYVHYDQEGNPHIYEDAQKDGDDKLVYDEKGNIIPVGEEVQEKEKCKGKSCQELAGAVRLSYIGRSLREVYEGAIMGRYLSILFGMGDSSWRRAMDQFFVHTVLGSFIAGNWEESFCHHYIDRAPAGTLYVVLPDGTSMVGVGAHIEAERNEATYINDSGHEVTEYFYKISVYVKNPEEATTKGAVVQDMDFRVMLYGERTVSLFDPPVIPVEPGESFVRTGSSMITFYSYYLYTSICIKFEDKIFTAAGDEVTEVCNSINVYTGAATAGTGGGGTGGGGGGSGGTPGDVNPDL